MRESQAFVNRGRFVGGGVEEYEVAAAVEMPPNQLRGHRRRDASAPQRLLRHDPDQLRGALERMRDSRAGGLPIEPGQQEYAARYAQLHTQRVDWRRLPAEVSAVRPADLLEGLQLCGDGPGAELRQVDLGRHRWLERLRAQRHQRVLSRQLQAGGLEPRTHFGKHGVVVLNFE